MISLEVVKILVVEVFGGVLMMMVVMVMVVVVVVVGRKVLVSRRWRVAVVFERVVGGAGHGVVEGLFVGDDGGVGLPQGGAGAGHLGDIKVARVT